MSSLLKLWQHPRFDDAGAFERAMEPHMTALYRLARRWCGDPGDAEDLLQDLMCKLYPRRAEVLAVEQLRPWLIRVMYRIFVDGTRRRRLRPMAFSSMAPAGGDNEDDDTPAVAEQPTDPDDEPEARLDSELSWKRLERALSRLSEDQRALVILHDVEGYTLPELADTLDARPGTLKVRLHRARDRLQTLLWNTDCNPSRPSRVSSTEDANHEL